MMRHHRADTEWQWWEELEGDDAARGQHSAAQRSSGNYWKPYSLGINHHVREMSHSFVEVLARIGSRQCNRISPVHRAVGADLGTLEYDLLVVGSQGYRYGGVVPTLGQVQSDLCTDRLDELMRRVLFLRYLQTS